MALNSTKAGINCATIIKEHIPKNITTIGSDKYIKDVSTTPAPRAGVTDKSKTAHVKKNCFILFMIRSSYYYLYIEYSINLYYTLDLCYNMVPPEGLEPSQDRVRTGYSATEL